MEYFRLPMELRLTLSLMVMLALGCIYCKVLINTKCSLSLIESLLSMLMCLQCLVALMEAFILFKCNLMEDQQNIQEIRLVLNMELATVMLNVPTLVLFGVKLIL